MNDILSKILAEKGNVVYSVRSDMTVYDAVVEMNDKNIGSVLVVDYHSLSGIFTERDVLKRVVAKGRDPKTTLVRQVMTSRPIVLSPQTTVDEAMNVIREKRTRHLPLVENGRLVGLISIGDIIRWVSRMHQFEADHLRAYIVGSYV